MRRAACESDAVIPGAGAVLSTLVVTGLLAAPAAVCTLADPAIKESSGLATSSYNSHFVLTHNDSGGKPDYFVVDSLTGRTVARVPVRGATNVDWEDIAVSGHTVYLADIGDNRANRRSVTVYAVPERDTPAHPATAVATRLTYEDGPRDAEALLVPPGGPPKYVVSKQLFGAGVYAIDGTHLHRVADLEAGLVTGGSWSPDGTRIALVSYTGIFVYDAAGFPNAAAQRLALPSLKQAESITWIGNSAVLVGSEGVHSPVYRVAVPDVSAETPATASASVTVSPTAAGTRPSSGNAEPPLAPPPATGKPGVGQGRSSPIAAVILVVALVAVAVTRVRRRGRGGLG